MEITYVSYEPLGCFAEYDLADFNAIVGRNWVVARRTPRIVAAYGEDVICLSPKAYRNAQRLAHLRRTEGFG
jgi:hypothetical protein